jgi:uncharacterized RDD family membrane protein YckC
VSRTATIRPEWAERERIMVTPEGIALPLVLASRGARFAALFIDFMLIGLLMLGTTLLLALLVGGIASLMQEIESRGPAGRALEFLFVLWIAAMFLFRNAYFLLFELGPRGATPGKRIAGIRIAARNGGRLSAEMVIARNLLRDIELFLPLVFIASASEGQGGPAGLAAALWFATFALFPCFNRDRLRAGDIVAGTWVIEAPKRKLATAMSLAPADDLPVYRFGEAELAIYGEYELQTLERVLREHNDQSHLAVAEAICRKIGWTPPGELEARRFLDAYYTQLRARLEAGMRLGQRKKDKFG